MLVIVRRSQWLRDTVVPVAASRVRKRAFRLFKMSLKPQEKRRRRAGLKAVFKSISDEAADGSSYITKACRV